MFSRHLLVALTVCLSLAVGLALQPLAAQAQDEEPRPTAEQLFEQGMEAFDAGEYQAALDLFHRIDTMQLSREQRAERSERIAQLEAHFAGEIELTPTVEAPDDPPPPAEPAEPVAPAEPEEPVEVAEPEAVEEPAEPEAPEAPVAPGVAELMGQADDAARRGDHEAAVGLYRQVSRHEGADAETRQRAIARQAEMQRRLDAELIQVRDTLEAARRDIDAGNYDAAAEHLEAVRQSDVRLGWFDQRRLNLLSDRLVSERAEAERLAQEEAERLAAEEAERLAREEEERRAREEAARIAAHEEETARLMQEADAAAAQGQHQQAIALYQRVADDEQVDAETRERALARLASVERAAREAEVAALMQQADEAARGGEHAQAATLYREISRHEHADAQTREIALARQAEMQRRIDAELIEVRQSLDAARRDLDAGAHESAAAHLEAVRASEVELGWFDQRRLDLLSERVAAEREAVELAQREEAERLARQEAIAQTLQEAQTAAEQGDHERAATLYEQVATDEDADAETRELAATRREQAQRVVAHQAQIAQRMEEADAAAEQGEHQRAAELYEQVAADEDADAQARQRASVRSVEMQRVLSRQAEAAQLMAAADTAAEQGEHGRAATLYARVIDDEYADAEMRQRAESQLVDVRRAQAQAELAQVMDQAAVAAEQGDHGRAAMLYQQVIDAEHADEPTRELAAAGVADLERAAGEAQVTRLMQDADEAARQGEHQRAAGLYRQVVEHDAVDAQTRDRASARLAEMQRRIDAQVIEARQALDAARSDIDAGRYDRAAERLDEVRTSGVRLGWFDQQRLDRLSERVAVEREAAERLAREEREVDEPVTDPEAPAEPDEPVEVAEVDEPEAPEEPVDPALPTPQITDDMLESYRLARAEQRLAEAREAAEAGQYALAIRHYEAVLRLDPEDPEQVRDELEAARAQRAAAAAPETPLEREAERLELLRERTVAVFERRMSEAQQLRQQRNFPAAQDAVTRAMVVLDDNRALLGERRYRELHRQAESLSTMLAQERRLEEERRIREAELTAREEQIRQRQEIREEREREVQSLLRRAHELRLDMEYEQALQLIDQALALDPNNWATQSMKISIEDAHELTTQARLRRRQSLEMTRQATENLEASIPYSDLIQYPADWPQITERRLRELDDAARESEADRRARLALEEPVPISFDANRLDNVIDFLRTTTGANFFVNWSALELAGVDQDTPITLHLENIPARQALRLVLEQAGAAEFDPIGFSVIEGVVHVSTERDLQQTTDVRVYDIRDLLVQVPNFDSPPNLGAGQGAGGRGGQRGGQQRGGQQRGGAGGTTGGGGLFGDGMEDRESSREEMIEEITTLIRESIGRFDEWVEAGGDVSSLREMNGNLIVRTTPGNHRELLGLLDQLRATRAIQISVEARFLLVDQNFLERVGVDMDAQISDPGGDFGPIRMAQDHISLASPSPSFLSPFSGQDGAGVPPGFGDGAAGGFIGSGRAFDLTASYLSDIEVNLIVTATQRHRRAISLTAPRVTFFNGQHAFVAVVREISFISDLDLVPDAFGFNPTADVLEVGVFLGVEGVVSSDRRYVTLTLQPMLSSLADLRAVPFIASDTIDDPDDPDEDRTITLSGTIELPETETTAVGATVSIPDQGTLLLGGQRLVQDREVEAGVPVLSKLPLVNRLFTNRGVTQDERTLLLLIKPTIIIQQEEEERRFPGLQEGVEQFNIGNRVR